MLTSIFFCGAIALGQTQTPTKATPQAPAPTATPPAPEFPTKTLPTQQSPTAPSTTQETLGSVQVVWLQAQNCWGEGQQILGNSPYIGKWRIKRKWTDAQGTQYTYTASGSGDPSGMVDILNQKRAARGLRPVAYDANAAAWAAVNNQHQRSWGLGHHVTGGYAQNAAIGSADIWSAWDNSPAHAAMMYDPNLVSAGGHFDGYAGTLNANGHYASNVYSGYGYTYPTYYGYQTAQLSGYRYR